MNKNGQNPLRMRAHYHFQIYGKRVCSDINLPGLLAAKFDVSDIRFSWEQTGVARTEHTDIGGEPKRFTTNVGCDLVVTNSGNGYSLLWEGKCQFFVSSDGSRIRCFGEPDIEFGWVISLLYSMVFSFSLHLQGLPNVHAGCVVTEDGAVGLMAAPGTGKSTLTAVLAASGMPILTDDILAVTTEGDDLVAYPGLPVVSLTRESASLVLDSAQMSRYESEYRFEKARIKVDSDWAEFSSNPQPLVALVLLTRNGQSVGAHPTRMSHEEAVRAIMENTVALPFLPADALKAYFNFAVRVAVKTPVWRVPVPERLSDLPRVGPQLIHSILQSVGV